MNDKQSAYEWRRKLRRIGFAIDNAKNAMVMLEGELNPEDYLLSRRYTITTVEELRKEALDKIKEMEQALLQVGNIYANLIPTREELKNGENRLERDDEGRNDSGTDGGS